MRFRELVGARAVSLATYFAILLFNVYTLSLYFNQQLTLYIHPRYILFTVALNAVSLVACGVGFVLTAWRMGTAPSRSGIAITSPGPASSVPWRPSFTVLVAGLVLVAAYALPARTLSSDTADQRSANFNSVQAQPSGSEASGGAGGDTLTLFGADTSRLTVADWALAFNLRSAPSSYVGKEVDVVGFVFHPKGTPEDIFYVSRFSVTCCAVDARPLGLPVYSPGWQEEFEEDSWVRVTGSFAETEEDIAEPVVVTPENIELTEQPEDPYVN
jgi:putative membrane protein